MCCLFSLQKLIFKVYLFIFFKIIIYIFFVYFLNKPSEELPNLVFLSLCLQCVETLLCWRTTAWPIISRSRKVSTLPLHFRLTWTSASPAHPLWFQLVLAAPKAELSVQQRTDPYFRMCQVKAECFGLGSGLGII